MDKILAHWPQWLIFASLAVRAIVCLVGVLADQLYIRVPVLVIVLYTTFLCFCLWRGGFWQGMLP